MAAQGLDETVLAELLVRIVERFGDAVRVEHQGISGEELAFADRAVPRLEKANYGAGGIQAIQSVIAPEEKPGEMAAVGIAQTPRRVVIFRKEERGEGSIGRILAEEAVYGL